MKTHKKELLVRLLRSAPKTLALVLSTNLFVLAAQAAGRVVAWNSSPQTNSLVDVSNVVAIAAGDYEVPAGGGNPVGLALKADGTVVGLVEQTNGNVIAIPLNDYGPTNLPPGLTNVVAIAAGEQHGLALKADGSVLAWGDDSFGQIDVPSGLANVVAISAGALHSLALKADGGVVVWGDTDPQLPSDLSNIVAVAAARFSSLALRDDGTVLFWGGLDGPGANGWIDIGPSLTNVVKIAAGERQNWAFKADGTVVAWGAYLCFGPDFCSLVLPENVEAKLTNTVALACSATSSVALLNDGTVTLVEWYGGPPVAYPIVYERVGGLTNIVAISSSGSGLALVGDAPPTLQVPITAYTRSATNFSCLVATQSGRVYRLEYKNSLVEEKWTPLPLVAGNGGAQALTAVATSQRFYRVRRW